MDLSNAVVKVIDVSGSGGYLSDDYTPDISISGMLDTEPTKDNKPLFKEIESFLKEKSEDRLEQLKTLQDLKFRIGTPPAGTNYLTYLHRYIKLMREAEFLTTQAKAMER